MAGNNDQNSSGTIIEVVVRRTLGFLQYTALHHGRRIVNVEPGVYKANVLPSPDLDEGDWIVLQGPKEEGHLLGMPLAVLEGHALGVKGNKKCQDRDRLPIVEIVRAGVKA